MQVRTSKTEDEVAAATQVDLRATSTCSRAQYIATVAEVGGLKLAVEQGHIVGFCCVDNRYFFEKVFISLLIVNPDSRRRGVGQELIEAVALDHPELWTSTNRSNAKMRGLLGKLDWQFCGEIEGLDADDPEMFFKKLG
ncbi:MAG: GNAT family N-acetyltransferase [Pseudomonadota bacterium]